MELTCTRVNVAAMRERGHSPGDVLRRGHPNEVWYVPFQPVDFQAAPDWRYYKRESSIYIPMFAYRTAADPVDVIGFAFQLGVRAMHDLGRPAKRLHLSLGAPAEQVYDEQSGNTEYLFVLGFGVVLE